MKLAALALPALALLALPLAAAAALTPGMYEYTMTMNMSGMSMPARTIQRCLTAEEANAKDSYAGTQRDGSDCKISDYAESGGKFSYKMSCSKPDKMNATVTGAGTATTVSMTMTMTMDGGTMTQTTNGKRIGDCK